MPKKYPREISTIYSKEELLEHINDQLDDSDFNRHCQEVADNLGIDVTVVRELLIDNSFTVLNLLQSSILKKKNIKINITGYFRLVTKLKINPLIFKKKKS